MLCIPADTDCRPQMLSDANVSPPSDTVELRLTGRLRVLCKKPENLCSILLQQLFCSVIELLFLSVVRIIRY